MPMRMGAEAAEASSKSFASDRLNELFFKDGDEVFLRFVSETDQWPVVDTHIAVPTKEKPARWPDTSNFPKAMGATCANDAEAFQGADAEGNPDGVWEEGFGHCYIHENYADQLDRFKNPISKARPMTYALVVVRERQGNTMRDKTEEHTDAKGNKRQIPQIRVVCQPWGRFFSAIKAGAFEDGLVRTRDFRITKANKEFTITPLSILPGHHPAVTDHPVLGTADATASWKLYEDTLQLIKADLVSWIRNRAGEEWMKLWFWPGEWDEKKAGDTEAENAGTQVSEGGGSQLADLSAEEEAKFKEYAERLRNQQAAASS